MCRWNAAWAMSFAGWSRMPHITRWRPEARSLSARSSNAFIPVASIAVMFRRRNKTTFGSDSKSSSMMDSLSVAPNRKGP